MSRPTNWWPTNYTTLYYSADLIQNNTHIYATKFMFGNTTEIWVLAVGPIDFLELVVTNKYYMSMVLKLKLRLYVLVSKTLKNYIDLNKIDANSTLARSSPAWQVEETSWTSTAGYNHTRLIVNVWLRSEGATNTRPVCWLIVIIARVLNWIVTSNRTCLSTHNDSNMWYHHCVLPITRPGCVSFSISRI